MCPVVEKLCQGGSLSASRWQIPFQDKYQHYVTLRGKVRHILGYNGPAFRPGRCGDLRVIGCPQAYLGDVDGVLAVGIAQQFGRGDQETSRRSRTMSRQECFAFPGHSAASFCHLPVAVDPFPDLTGVFCGIVQGDPDEPGMQI